MSESVPSRMDAVDPAPRTPSSASAGDLVPAVEAGLASPDAIERMAERLRFYESFDELIQQNIARSGQLMREAADKRGEAVAAIAQARQQIETERETQRAALTELLDDVMTIQQATERLAHRVSDALEQIEFDLEPVGLQTAGSLASQGAGQLPGLSGTSSNSGRSVAEDVHDEYRLGVIGQPTSSSAPGAVTVGHRESDERLYTSESAIPPVDDFAEPVTTANPETSAAQGNEIAQQDPTGPTGQIVGGDGTGSHEPEVGEGPEAAPVETSSGAWDRSSPQPTSNEDESLVDDLPSELREQPSESQAYGEVTRDQDVISGRSPTGAGTTTASPADDATMRSDDARSTWTGRHAVDGTVVTDDASPAPSGRDDATLPAPDDPDPSAGDGSSTSPGDPHSEADALTTTVVWKESSDDWVAPPGPVTEQQTTVVLDGVPRAAIALAIQRHLLAKPDVVRAEVREYYDHRLTLFVTARRTTTANDLEDWDGGASWEHVRSSSELLELRMVM